MTATIAPAIAREIVAWVRRSDGTDASLTRIANDHGLQLRELKQLLGNSAAPTPRPGGASPAAHALADTDGKKCTQCNEVKPLSEYLDRPDTRDKKSSECRLCNNKRPRTPARMIEGRARGRAYRRLAKAHPEEFERLFAEETEKARAEHDAQLVPAAAARGHADATVARLKPGPKRRGQASTIERLDVARCPDCHRYHDAGHPECALPADQAVGQ